MEARALKSAGGQGNLETTLTRSCIAGTRDVDLIDLASDESDDEAPDDDEDPGHKPGSPVAETDLEGNWGAVKAAFAFAEDAARPAKGDKCR